MICGGSPEDQLTFVKRYVARPPPQQVVGRAQQRQNKPKGEVALANRFGLGYGHVTLYSPPQKSEIGGGLGGEVEEAAKVEVHTIPEAKVEYLPSLRRFLELRGKEEEASDPSAEEGNDFGGDTKHYTESEQRRPAVCLLLSWKEPWNFLKQLRHWLNLLSLALLPSSTPTHESPLEVLKEHHINLTVVLQHVEVQEMLLRENYTEETFDLISQCIRTCVLPLDAALVYTTSIPPPQPPASPLSEIQKVIYASLNLNVATLQAKNLKTEDAKAVPKHEFFDRMAVVVPSKDDSAAKVRMLSETFSPESFTEGWTSDLNLPVFSTSPIKDQLIEVTNDQVKESQTNSGAEVYESAASPIESSPLPSSPLSPSKGSRSAIREYEESIVNPNAHKQPKPPALEVSTKPEQEFLAEMRRVLQRYEQQDAERERQRGQSSQISSTASALIGGSNSTSNNAALEQLGDVSFNVGGVNYNSLSAEAAIERLKRPQVSSMESSSGASTPRTSTPRPPRREGGEITEGRDTPGSGKGDIPTEKLEEYFASLMKRGTGGSSRGSTPSRQ